MHESPINFKKRDIMSVVVKKSEEECFGRENIVNLSIGGTKVGRN